ncbi:hypothetical protein BDQ17DRAFT_1352325 [Cyathus striatus]|nr:hypothetical protein BDQ17DRAFT_1352325 [Cyathus striatus]
MSSQPSIGEPFLLSSYSIPQKKPGKLSKKSVATSLHATFTAKGSSEGYVSTLHPVISHTLGPTISFACPAVTCISSSSKTNICTTYAAIASSSSSTSSSTNSDAQDSIRVQAQSLNEDEGIEELGFCELEVKPSQISSLSLSSSGCLTILSRDLSLQSYLLSVPSSPSPTPTIITKPLPSLTLAALAQSPSRPSILALTSTHVLLASTTTSQDEVALLLWDMQYGVLLTSHNFPVPSSMKESGGISAQLVDAGQGQAVCILSPLESKKQQATLTTVLVTSYSVPLTSTIANALGKALNGARWIKKDSSPVAAAPYNEDKSKLVAEMRTAMDQNRIQAANDLFFSWAKGGVLREAEVEDEEVKRNEERPELDYTFVKDILNIVLQVGKPANAPYSSEVVRYLLGNKVVSTAMVEGGILATLRVKGDWKSIETAFDTVVDLTETELITTLYVVLAHHRLQSAKSDDNVMEVDQPASSELSGDIPSTASFLAMVLNYPTSSTPLRMAIRTHFKQAEDLATLLEISSSWLAQWNELPVRVLPTVKELRKDENGAFIFDDIVFREKKRGGLPNLSKITYFVQTVLDAGFVTLLTYTPSHKILGQLHARLDSEIARSEQFQYLRGPLESFVQAQAKAVKEAARKKEKGKGQPTTDWRQRRKQAQAQAGLSIGVYQLEELLL